MTTPTVTSSPSSGWPETLAEDEAVRRAQLRTLFDGEDILEPGAVKAGTEDVFGMLERSGQ
jgi:hypothetical protein